MRTSTHTWRLHLLKQAGTLERLGTVRRWGDASRVRLEESVALSRIHHQFLGG